MSEKTDKKTNDYLDEDGNFKKGNPGGGRPKGTSGMTEKMRSYLAKRIDPTDPDSKSRMEELVESIRDNAVKGDTSAQKMIWEQLDGKPLQKQETKHTGDLTVNTILYGDRDSS